MALFGSERVAKPIASMSFDERLSEVFSRTLPKVGPEARAQLAAMIEPKALAIVAGVLAVWVASHFFGVGEAVDIVLGVVGVFSIGWAVFEGIGEIFNFASETYNGRDTASMESAAGHLAKGISILGIQAVLALLFKGRPKTYEGEPIKIGAPPPGKGPFYRPKIKGDPSLPPGEGGTTAWGDVRYSTQGPLTEQRLVKIHEMVHSILTPKFALFRRLRVQSRMNSYVKSALRQYIEEALAETIAQVNVNGLLAAFKGLSFPVQNGYVTVLFKTGEMMPVLPELGAVFIGGVFVNGLQGRIFFTSQKPADF